MYTGHGSTPTRRPISFAEIRTIATGTINADGPKVYGNGWKRHEKAIVFANHK